MSTKIRVAIVGGGVAGASMLHALLKYPHLDVHIFESATAFREAGVAFGLARNATAALSLIGPSALQCLERAGGVPMQGVRFLLGAGPNAGELVYEADNETSGKQTVTIVQRANLLQQFLAGVPEEQMHASKNLRTIERKEDGTVVIHFADETTHECDIVIGADGIHSTIRKIILGENNPATAPRNSGTWAIMKLVPYEEARASIGDAPINIEDAREYGWITDHVFVLHNILSNGSLVQFLVCGYDGEASGSDTSYKTLSREQIHALPRGRGWLPHLKKAMDELLCDKPEQRAFYIYDHLPADTYVDGPICIIGDAAHATTPYQGSGGGMCVEDSLVLSTLLGRAESTSEALVALKVYDQNRRARTQKIVRSSWQTGKMFMDVHEDTGLDAQKLKPVMAPRWDFIIDYDNEEHLNEAVSAYEALLRIVRARDIAVEVLMLVLEMLLMWLIDVSDLMVGHVPQLRLIIV